MYKYDRGALILTTDSAEIFEDKKKAFRFEPKWLYNEDCTTRVKRI